MNRSREWMDCGASVDAGPTERADTTTGVPELMQKVAQLEEEKTYLRSMVCELLRKNERLRDEVRSSYREVQPHASWADQADSGLLV